jgi:hypothetical protein
MKDNTIILLAAEAGLFGLAAIGALLNELALAYTAAGAFVGVLGGHLNGNQTPKEQPKITFEEEG